MLPKKILWRTTEIVKELIIEKKNLLSLGLQKKNYIM